MNKSQIQNSKTRLSRHESVISARLARIINHRAIRFDADQTGYEFHKFGGRAHTVTQVNFFHEIAHVIEFGSHSFKKRIDPSLGCFKFKYGKSHYALGRIYHEYDKTVALRRELRTIAIQVKLAKMCGVKRDVQSMIAYVSRAMRWMPDYWNIPECYGEESRMDYCVNYVTSFYETVSEDVIISRLTQWLDKVERTKIFKNSQKSIN